MANQDWRNQLASAYGNMQQSGATSPSRQQRLDRRENIRQQVNPGVRPVTMVGGTSNPTPQPSPMPYEQPPQPELGINPQPRPMTPPTLSPYPEMGGELPPPVWDNPGIQGPNGEMPGQPSLVQAAQQPIETAMPEEGFDPVVPGGGAW